MELICEHSKCTGCQACKSSCPKNAISMHEDARGHIYPVIDKTLCIDCGKCQKVCPSLNLPKFSHALLKVYAAHSKNKKARHYSTSGAVSYELLKAIIKAGGYICGVVWENNQAKHKLTNNLDDLKQFQGSKYSHSDVGNVYVEIKDLLNQGILVLFTGTPCQCSALRNFLGKNYDNLFVVDIVCHGVPSRRVLRECIKDVEQRNNKRVVYVRFRDKQPDQLHTYMRYMFEDGTSEDQKYTESFFSRSFVDDYILRENCYNCLYSRSERVSDITMADFWGYQPRRLKFRNCWEGISIVLVNNEQGQILYNMVASSLQYEERSLAENVNQNLHAPQPKPENIAEYWEDYENGLDKSIMRSKYLTKEKESKILSPIDRLKRDLLIVLPDVIKNAIMKRK